MAASTVITSVLAAIVLACQPIGNASPTDKRNAQTLSPTSSVPSVSVRFASGAEWADRLRLAWRVATLDRSRLEVRPDGQLTIYVFPGRGTSYTVPNSTVIFLYEQTHSGQPLTTTAFLHEIGHVLGCCYGPGTRAGHFVSGEPGIMSDPRAPRVMLFQERELAQMGLGSSSRP